MAAGSSGGRQCAQRNLLVRLSIVRFTEAILTCEMPADAPAASIASWAARRVAQTCVVVALDRRAEGAHLVAQT